MEQTNKSGQALHINPYITQVEKLVNSFQCLTKFYEGDEGDSRYYTQKELLYIHNKVCTEVCENCVCKNNCKIREQNQVLAVVKKLIIEVDEYGVELSVTTKRDLERTCKNFKEFKQALMLYLMEVKHDRVWRERVKISKQASIVTMRTFMDAINHVTKELDASIFEDDRLQKKIILFLRKLGIRPLKVMLFVAKHGHYEIHISAKTKQGNCISSGDIAEGLSKITKRNFIPEYKEKPVVKEEYETIVFVEKPTFQVLTGMAKIEKAGSQISGDNFLVVDIPGGRKCVLLSDGMGSGQDAFEESKLILELAEVLLEAGIEPELVIEMINATLVTGNEDIVFGTLDMCILDQYRGMCEYIKAGSATTYELTKFGSKIYQATTLPLGILADIKLDHYYSHMDDNGYIVMITDGVLELIPNEKRETYIQTIMEAAKTRNPNELAQIILTSVLELQQGNAVDDMLVLVIGTWKITTSKT